MKITLPAERLASTWLNVWQATASTGVYGYAMPLRREAE